MCNIVYNLKEDSRFDDQWVKSLYFKPAYDMVKRLENKFNLVNNSSVDFLSLDTISSFKKHVKISAFYEFNDFWNGSPDGRKLMIYSRL